MEKKSIHRLQWLLQMKPVGKTIYLGKMPIFSLMKKQINYLSLFTLIIILSACTSAQISSALKTYGDLTGEGDDLTTSDVIAGLKEALIVGSENSTRLTSQTDGFFKNPEIKVPFPQEIQEVETRLRQIGMNKLVDNFNLSINRAAEKASAEAKTLFISAIRSMTVEDAWSILKGEEDAATQYLRRTTSADLENKFRPIIDRALESVDATKYYGEITTVYNKIPLVTKVDTDLTNYVTGKALDGLFIMVAKEEAKIREDPLARTTELLKRVFSQQ